MPPGSTTATTGASMPAFARWGQLMARSLIGDLDRAGLGLRLKYLSGGMSEDARRVGDYIVPGEVPVTYIGARMVEQAVNHADLPGQSARARARSLPSPAPPQPQPSYFPTQNELNTRSSTSSCFDRSDQLLERGHRCSQMNRSNGRRQFRPPARLAETAAISERAW